MTGNTSQKCSLRPIDSSVSCPQARIRRVTTHPGARTTRLMQATAAKKSNRRRRPRKSRLLTQRPHFCRLEILRSLRTVQIVPGHGTLSVTHPRRRHRVLATPQQRGFHPPGATWRPGIPRESWSHRPGATHLPLEACLFNGLLESSHPLAATLGQQGPKHGRIHGRRYESHAAVGQ